MDILKKTALGVCATLLFTTLFGFGLSYGLYQTFNKPDTLKDSLKDSGIYSSVVGNALDRAQKEQAAPSADGIPVNDPDVQKIIQNAVSPELLQTQTEGAVDSIYNWIQGKTPKLEFSIELGEAEQNIVNGLGAYVEQRAASLPACDAGTTPSNEVNPFNTTCLPSGVSPSQLAVESKNQILNGDFFKEPVLTPDTIESGNDKTLEQQLQAAPTAYKRTTWLVYGTAVTSLLLVVLVVFLSATRRAGLKKAAIILIIAGSLSAILGWLVGLGMDRLLELTKDPLQQSLVKVAEQLTGNLRSWWLWYGIALVTTGIVALVVLRFTRPKAVASMDEPKEPTGETLPSAPIVTPKPAQKPKPVKKLVQ